MTARKKSPSISRCSVRLALVLVLFGRDPLCAGQALAQEDRPSLQNAILSAIALLDCRLDFRQMTRVDCCMSNSTYLVSFSRSVAQGSMFRSRRIATVSVTTQAAVLQDFQDLTGTELDQKSPDAPTRLRAVLAVLAAIPFYVGSHKDGDFSFVSMGPMMSDDCVRVVFVRAGETGGFVVGSEQMIEVSSNKISCLPKY